MMTGPRLHLPFGPGACSPFSNCTQRDSLITLITNLNFEEDGLDNNMDCSHSSNSYVLQCRSFYESSMQMDNIIQSRLVSQPPDTTISSNQILGLLLILCVILIFFLSLNTLRLERKLRKCKYDYMTLPNGISYVDRKVLSTAHHTIWRNVLPNRRSVLSKPLFFIC